MNLETILKTLKAFKEQQKIVLKSNGNNKQINKVELFKIQSQINPIVINNFMVLEFMNQKNLKSFIDIDIEEFSTWWNNDFKF